MRSLTGPPPASRGTAPRMPRAAPHSPSLASRAAVFVSDSSPHRLQFVHDDMERMARGLPARERESVVDENLPRDLDEGVLIVRQAHEVHVGADDASPLRHRISLRKRNEGRVVCADITVEKPPADPAHRPKKFSSIPHGLNLAVAFGADDGVTVPRPVTHGGVHIAT